MDEPLRPQDRVLITGAAGFIGRHCLPARSEGVELHAVSSRPQAHDPRIHWHTCNLLDPAAAARLVAEVQPTHLLHLAWITDPACYLSAVENLRWLEASIALVEQFADCGGRRLVIAGTCFEYEPSSMACLEAATPLAPRTLYGACKTALRHVASRYCRDRGTSMAMTHVFNLYGPLERRSRIVPGVALALLAGRPAQCTAGVQRRDFMHVADVAAAHVRLLTSSVCGDVNVASGQPIRIAELAEAIAAACGRRDLLELGALPSRAGEAELLTADIRRLRDEVGFVPQYDLQTGLEQTIAWWRSTQMNPAAPCAA